jgi:hypothetical protein
VIREGKTKSGSEMNISESSDHISESLLTVLGLKLIKVFVTDPGPFRQLDPGFEKSGFGKNILDSQHCYL